MSIAKNTIISCFNLANQHCKGGGGLKRTKQQINRGVSLVFATIVDQETQLKGRPKHCHTETTTKLGSQNPEIIKENHESWQTEDTVFACIRKLPNGG